MQSFQVFVDLTEMRNKTCIIQVSFVKALIWLFHPAYPAIYTRAFCCDLGEKKILDIVYLYR